MPCQSPIAMYNIWHVRLVADSICTICATVTYKLGDMGHVLRGFPWRLRVVARSVPAVSCAGRSVDSSEEHRAIMAFNARKAAQVAAFFANKEGGRINVLKLTKLLYLADRACMDRYDRPILYDWLVSMDHGPVNSYTLNLINGLAQDDGWDDFVLDRAHHDVGAKNKRMTEEDFDELSEFEVSVLSGVWREFGRMTKYQIRDYTHKHCPEWENPRGTSLPIPYERVFKFLGKKHSDELADQVEDARSIDQILLGGSGV